MKDKSAFPSWNVEQANPGVSKREEFAKTAMAAILSSSDPRGEWPPADKVALKSIEYGDALLAQLEKNQE